MLQLTVEELNHLIALLDAQRNNVNAALSIKFANEIKRLEELEEIKHAVSTCMFEIENPKRGNIVETIKFYRSVTGCGLREAHDFVNNCLHNGKGIIVESTKQNYERALKRVLEYPSITIKEVN